MAVESNPDMSSNKGQNQEDVESNRQKSKEDEPYFPADELSTPRQILFITTIFGVIGESFGITNPGQLSWLIAGYSLTVGTFILIGGRLGDEFGNKRVFVLGMCWYCLWSLVAGLAVFSTHVLFIFARVFQGMGPAMTLPNGLAILGKSYSPKRRNMSFAWFGASAPFGAIAGFLFGGLFAQVWWPWIYWSQAIALAFVSGFAAWAIPSLPVQSKRDRTLREKLVDLDIPGGLIGVLALVLFNFSWNQAVVVGWKEPYVYVCLILGILFAAAFFCIEIYYAKNPILPIAAFNSDIAFVFACTATGWACFGIWVFYIGQVALEIDGNTPLQIAAWFVPVIPSGLISALVVGKVVGKIPASYIMIVGQVAYLVGSILAASRPPHTIYWTYFFFSVLIITVGMDTSFPASAMIFSSAVPRQYQGMSASIVMTIVNYSISLGLGFAGTIETNVNHGAAVGQLEKLAGYRAALWFSVGLAALGTLLSLVYEVKGRLKNRVVEA
ncbi:MFS transporter [Phlyctema vagabunda]|uniref:MFS transporter n=1 Tax=Phlyctema vagabunda TaxID=108571 RepID=A0ABR4PGF8_9HELO